MVDEVRRLALRGYYICARGGGAGVAPTEQVAERVESGGQRLGLYVCVRTYVRARDKTKPDQARPNPLYDI